MLEDSVEERNFIREGVLYHKNVQQVFGTVLFRAGKDLKTAFF